MLQILSDIEGKRAYYGEINENFEKQGFHMCGGWEYDEAYFDSIVYQHEGVTIYLRLPAHVLQGMLDGDDAYLEFGRPFLVKHVIHTGIIDDAHTNPLAWTGFDQFQPPLDPDDRIEQEDKWKQVGEKALHRIREYVH